MAREATAVLVYNDGDHAHRIGASEYYSVSLVDDEGDEITCVDGSEYLGDAWEAGLKLARERRIPCVEHRHSSGQETDRWDPPSDAQRIARAIEDHHELRITRVDEDEWALYDHGTQRWFVVDGDDLAHLGDEGADYSRWCTETDSEEQPQGWEPTTYDAENAQS